MRRALFWLVALTTSAWMAYRLRRQFAAATLQLTRPHFRVVVQRNIRVPMRDGVTLATDHYWPNAKGRFPTILIRCPYGVRPDAGLFGLLMSFVGFRFAERGYHVVIQDVRGRFDSEGEFNPLFNERADGQDTLAWISRQIWFNGQLGTWGPSYLGIVQWAIADSPLVQVMMPSVTASRLHQILFPDGALDLSLSMRWLALFQALDKRDNQLRVARPASLRRNWSTFRAARDRSSFAVYISGLLADIELAIYTALWNTPIREADQVALGKTTDYFQMWLEHAQADDSLWVDVQKEIVAERTKASVHLVGGWYDFFLRGQLQDYAALKAHGHTPYLTIGPYQHFSNAFLITNTISSGLAWFDAHLKGQVSKLREKPVQLYVMGANEWRAYDSWPPPSRETRLYLRERHRLDHTPAAQMGLCDGYHYDPADPTPAFGGAQFTPWGGAVDNRQLEARKDVLVYTGDALLRPVEVIGPVRLELYVKSSLPYTDFFGRLCDVYPNGRSVNICDGLFRLRPGSGLLCEDGVTRIEVDMWATAYRFRAGHRIRLIVASGAHPRWARNPGTGDDFSVEMKSADQTIYLDSGHRSALILPVVSP